MIVLGLDSSADTLSVTVLADGEPVAGRMRRIGRPGSGGGELLPVATGVLADAGLSLQDVGLVAVVTGPGSFNGIRSGIATAEGLSLALGVDAIGIPALDALAFAHAGRAPVIAALLPAGRGEVYAARYKGTWEDWRRESAYEAGSPAQAIAGLPDGALLCGRAPEEVRRLAQARGLAIAPPYAAPMTAVSAAALALQRSRDPAFDRRASLQPLYLRRPGITQPSRPLSLAGSGTPASG